MVSSRRAAGEFTAPVVLAREAADVGPAVAVNPDGEATVLWTGHDGQQVFAATWPAGGTPGQATVLDRYEPAGALASCERFRDLQLHTGASGGELATWLYGLPAEQGTRPRAAALRAAWRAPRASFGVPQTVSAPGVEAREPAVALDAAGGALIAWNELTSTGAGPVLSYAVSPPGGPFGEPATIPTPSGARSQFTPHG